MLISALILGLWIFIQNQYFPFDLSHLGLLITGNTNVLILMCTG